MYKIGGILFCLLTGVLVAKFGWLALIWGTLGFIFGIFASANIVLPILMGVPIATSLIIKKQMKPTVYFALLRAPIIWLAVLFLIGWFFPTVATWIYNNEPLNIEGNLGFALILFSPISKKARNDFRDDFDKAWGRYYTNPLNYSPTTTDKSHLKQMEAALKIFSNLYEHTRTTEKDSFRFQLPDSRFRYFIFCM